MRDHSVQAPLGDRLNAVDVVIETADLSKRYGAVTAVEQLSLRVKSGEIYAFLGLNGAGKTTTIRMLLGMIKATSGRAWVLGAEIGGRGKKPWEAVGHLVEAPNAYPELTVRENLEVLRRLRPGVESKAVGRVIEQLGLSAYADRKAGALSMGNAQRLGLAKALLHCPRLLILDEPANGLDPAGIVEVRKLLIELTRQQGVTVFMSSHLLSEVARLADQIGILHQGRLLQELDAAELEKNRRRRLLLCTRDAAATLMHLCSVGITAAMIEDAAIAVTDVAAIERPDDLAVQLVAAGFPPTMLVVEQEDLEHFFLRLVGAG
jgi:ABC-2 type transport system ATP-binding protein